MGRSGVDTPFHTHFGRLVLVLVCVKRKRFRPKFSKVRVDVCVVEPSRIRIAGFSRKQDEKAE